MKNLLVDARMIKSSGIGTYLENILLRIIPMKKNFNVTLLGDKKILSEMFPDTNIIHCTCSIYSVREQIELNRKITKEYDLLWSPHYNIPFLTSTKTLVTVHDFFHLDMPQFVSGINKKLYSKFMFKILARKASKVITVSEFSKSRALIHLGRNADCKVNVVYNGVGEDWFEFRGEKKFNKPYILYVGNVKPHKNLRSLIKAYEILQEDIKEDLVIVGKKEGFITGDDSISDISEELANKITFTGYVGDEELKAWVKGAKALIFPSLYEGFGLPPLEAMACGTPVLTSHAASLPEVCEQAAIYFDPYDVEDMAKKIKETLQDEETLQVLSKKGLAQATKFTWEKSVAQHLKVIESLL
ncbi:glycosyltransferase family 4 protein [Priestia flexa]|uniref:glycosyltransferase family 4 protein n=1 Tax=Priestia flexa TaxID=86664 RepID=UPI00077C6757|nr:glycosyltransferase family 1 protein [Priestia flexa]MED4590148.1 glycosyltransferase family 1 protein [Priestia flexa]